MLLNDLLVVQYYWGECNLQSKILSLHLPGTQLRFERYAVFRKACFTAHYFTGNSIAAAEYIYISQKYEKNILIIVYDYNKAGAPPQELGFASPSHNETELNEIRLNRRGNKP